MDTRDNWAKWFMRLLLSLIGMVVYASLLIQAAWHSYGIFNIINKTSLDEGEAAEFAFDPSFRDCAQRSLHLRFNTSCYQLFATIVPRGLLASH